MSVDEGREWPEDDGHPDQTKRAWQREVQFAHAARHIVGPADLA